MRQPWPHDPRGPGDVQQGRPPHRRTGGDGAHREVHPGAGPRHAAEARRRRRRCPAASTARWWPRSARARWARTRSSGSSCRSATRRTSRCGSAGCWPSSSASARWMEDIAPALEGLGCYARQQEAIRMVVPEYGPGWRCKIVIGSILEGDRLNLSSLTVADPGREPAHRAAAGGGLPAAGGGHQLQAADPQDDGVLPRRSAQLRGGRHAQPARVRPGLLREAGRRRGRLQAHRPPLQDARSTRWPSTSASPRRSAGGRPPPTPSRCRRRRRSSTSRCPTTRMDLCLWAHNHDVPAAEAAPAHRAHGRAGGAGLPGHRGQAARRPLPARARRCWSTTSR